MHSYGNGTSLAAKLSNWAQIERVREGVSGDEQHSLAHYSTLNENVKNKKKRASEIRTN